MLCVEKAHSQIVLQILSVLHLHRVIKDSRLPMQRRSHRRIRNLERSEQIYSHKHQELHSVPTRSKHLVVVQEVSAEENRKRLQIDDFGVGSHISKTVFCLHFVF